MDSLFAESSSVYLALLTVITCFSVPMVGMGYFIHKLGLIPAMKKELAARKENQ